VSDSAPGLTFDTGLLYLLWRGTDAQHTLNVLQSPDGANFGGKVTLGDTSDFHPALDRPHDFRLVWTGRDAGQHLNVLSTPALKTPGSKDAFADNSRVAPALVAFGNLLFLGWSGTDAPCHPSLAARCGEH